MKYLKTVSPFRKLSRRFYKERLKKTMSGSASKISENYTVDHFLKIITLSEAFWFKLRFENK